MIGAVLAGGFSQRMGSDKAGLILENEPLWRRQVNVLRGLGLDRVVLVRRPDQDAPPGIECWRDSIARIGPLAGLHAALLPRAADFVAVLAVDMPGIGQGWFEWLSGTCREGSGAMACHDNLCEPLAAIYPADAIAAVEAQIEAKDHSLQHLAMSLAAVRRITLLPLNDSGVSRAASLNTEPQLRAWESAREDRVAPEAHGVPSSPQSSP